MNPLLKRRLKRRLKTVTQPVIRTIAPPPDLPTKPTTAREGPSLSDRYFTDFLQAHRDAIRGRILDTTPPGSFPALGLEVTESTRLELPTEIEVVDAFRSLPSDHFDCLLVSKTLEYAYDLRALVAQFFRILAPGGTLLLAADCTESFVERDGRLPCWHLTENSCRRLMIEVFEEESLEIAPYGNFRSCLAALSGIPATELKEAELTAVSNLFVQGICVRARKPLDRDPGP